MNPNFDFRSDAIWNDREVTGSVGEDLQEFDDFLGLCLFMAMLAVAGVYLS